MKHRFFSFVTSIVMGLFLSSPVLAVSKTPPVDGQWKTVVSEGGGFRVQMPGKPQFQFFTEDSPIGDVEVFIYSFKQPNQEYTVNYSDLPKLARTLGGSKKILNTAKKSFLKDAQGQEVAFQETSYEGNPGRILTYRTKAPDGTNLQGRAHFFLVKNRIYVVVAAIPPTQANKQKAQKFFQSFALASAQ